MIEELKEGGHPDYATLDVQDETRQTIFPFLFGRNDSDGSDAQLIY